MEAMFDDEYYNNVEFEKPTFADDLGGDGESGDEGINDVLRITLHLISDLMGFVPAAITPDWEKEAKRVLERVRTSKKADDEAVAQEAQELEKALEDYYKLDYEDTVP